MAYYVSIGNLGEEVWFALEEWVNIFKEPTWVPILTPRQIRLLARNMKHYSVNTEPSNVDQPRNGKDTVNIMSRVASSKKNIKKANQRLEERGLIKLRRNHPGTMMGITLKIEGYDLGRKYSSWWTRSGLWFEEYKHHWIWIIVSFLVGIIGGLLINWLSKGD